MQGSKGSDVPFHIHSAFDCHDSCMLVPCHNHCLTSLDTSRCMCKASVSRNMLKDSMASETDKKLVPAHMHLL